MNSFFKLMEEIEATWKKIPEFAKVSLSVVSPGEDFANLETYEEDKTRCGLPPSKGSQQTGIVLGTAALGVHCLFQQREQSPRTLLKAKVILEDNLRYIVGVQAEQKPTNSSHLNTRQHGDGRDP